MNFQIYCDECAFATPDQEEAARHRAMNRGHELIPVRAGDVTQEQHTHICLFGEHQWQCDDPSCQEPDVCDCNTHIRKEVMSSTL